MTVLNRNPTCSRRVPFTAKLTQTGPNPPEQNQVEKAAKCRSRTGV